MEYSQLVPGLKTGRAGPSDLGRSFGVIDAKVQGMHMQGARAREVCMDGARACEVCMDAQWMHNANGMFVGHVDVTCGMHRH